MSTPDEVFTATLYQMDIERVRYALARYLRTRVLKIEKMLMAIISNIELMSRLSKHEKVFATRLHNLNNTYYEESFSNRLSENVKEAVESSEDRFKNCQTTLHVFFITSFFV